MSKSSVVNLAEAFARRAAYAKTIAELFPDATCEVKAGEEDKYESNLVGNHPERKAEYFAEYNYQGGRASGIGVRWYVEIKPRKLPAVRVYDRNVGSVPLSMVAELLNNSKHRAEEHLRQSA